MNTLKEKYGQLDTEGKTRFRIKYMEHFGWANLQSFYRRLHANKLTPAEREAVEKVLRENVLS
jgi:hypothetical protein